MSESPFSPEVLAQLGNAGAYPDDGSASAGVESLQTHISYVFLTTDCVYKFRKDVDHGFIRFDSRELRNADCLDEVRLNRRLAPDVYLGVAPLLFSAGKAHIGPVVEQLSDSAGDGHPEHCVVMRRLPHGRDALSLLEEGALQGAQLDRVANVLVRFHASTGLGTPTALSSDEWRERWRGPVDENFRLMKSCSLGADFESTVARARERADEFAIAHADRFEARRLAGRVVDAHGDLHLQHIWFERDDSQPLMIDCLEFNPGLRQIDVASEIAFPAMDLYYRGAAELAERLLRVYANESDDFDLYSVVDYFISYRAAVRAKVAALAASDPRIDAEQRTRAVDSAGRHVTLASSALDRSQSSALVLVGGIVGSGKTTVANALADELGAVVISTDRVRKHQLGLAAGEHPRPESLQDIYGAENKREIYEALLVRARPVLASGRRVVLDGTFSRHADRQRAQAVAAEAGVPCLFVEARCEEAVAMERLARRESSGRDASDAGPAQYQASAAEFEALSDWDANSTAVIHTDRDAWRKQLSAAAMRLLDR